MILQQLVEVGNLKISDSLLDANNVVMQVSTSPACHINRYIAGMSSYGYIRHCHVVHIIRHNHAVGQVNTSQTCHKCKYVTVMSLCGELVIMVQPHGRYVAHLSPCSLLRHSYVVMQANMPP